MIGEMEAVDSGSIYSAISCHCLGMVVRQGIHVSQRFLHSTTSSPPRVLLPLKQPTLLLTTFINYKK